MTTTIAMHADATPLRTGSTASAAPGARRFGRREVGLLLGLLFAGLLTGGGFIAAAAEPAGGLRAAVSEPSELGALIGPMRSTR